MGRFLESEKRRLAALKVSSDLFSPAACVDGVFKGKQRPFCIGATEASENLYPPIRQAALDYFKRHGIPWHQGSRGDPSNHLCDSQVCCVNFLQPFSRQPDALAVLLRPFVPEIRRMLPMEEREDEHVAFEWIGRENYLGEKVSKKGRMRGANATSVDAAVMYETANRAIGIVLIEWKYTESYSSSSLAVAPSGTDRTETYRPLYEREGCPIDRVVVPDFRDLFYEPFYQFMRQQLLTHEMELAQELGATRVSLLHLAPAANQDFQRVTSPNLQPLGETATGVWSRILKASDRFLSVSVEEVFGSFPVGEFPELRAWWDYISERYAWMRRQAA